MLTISNHQPAAEVAKILGLYGSPLFVAEVTRVQLLMANYAYEALDFELINLVLGQQYVGEASLLDKTNVIVREHIAIVLRHHGVEIDEDADLTAATDILEAILEAPTWKPVDDIERILDADCSEEERLIELARLVRDPRSPHYETAILDVEPSFSARMREVIVEGFHTEDEMESPDPAHIKVLRQYKEFAPDAVCFRLLQVGYQINSSAESYLQRAQSSIINAPNEIAAREIVGFLFMSRDGWREPLARWNAVAQVLNLELHELATLGVEVTKQLNLFDTFKATHP